MSPTILSLSGDEIADRLQGLGFERRATSDDGRRALFALGELRFVLPTGDRVLPRRIVQLIESSLVPVFGPDPFAVGVEDRRAGGGRVEPVVVLDAAVLADRDGWYAYLVDEPSIFGFGRERVDALRDLKEASAVRLGTTTERVALLTSTVV